jgi:hypothetical protein
MPNRILKESICVSESAHNKRTWVYVVGVLRNFQRSGRNRNKDDPDKFIKGKYGHMVHR